MSAVDNDYLIERFRLERSDYKKMADLITTSFLNDEAAIEEGASISFTENTFDVIFGSPTVKKDFFVRAIYRPTNEVVGFLGLIPRDLSIEGQVYRFAIPAWLCVHWEHRRKGLAKLMGKKLLEIAKEEDFDGGFSLFEPEQHGIDTSKSVAKEENIPFRRIVSTDKFIIRVFDANEVASVVKLKWYEKLFFKYKQTVPKLQNSRVREYEDEDIEELFALTQDLVKRNQIAIVPTFEDFKWLLDNPGTICVVYENEEGKIKGFILAWELILLVLVMQYLSDG
ncbi:MAG: GNAT family N-acetyltransferase [Candidatus Heimdallarchaeaceae archaeon]